MCFGRFQSTHSLYAYRRPHEPTAHRSFEPKSISHLRYKNTVSHVPDSFSVLLLLRTSFIVKLCCHYGIRIFPCRFFHPVLKQDGFFPRYMKSDNSISIFEPRRTSVRSPFLISVDLHSSNSRAHNPQNVADADVSPASRAQRTILYPSLIFEHFEHSDDTAATMILELRWVY